MLSVFIGENLVEREKALKTFIDNFVATNGDMALDKLEAENITINDLIDAVTTVPFLANKRMVVIKYLSANKELADQLAAVVERMADTTELVIIETRIDSRSIYSKNLKKLADTYKTFSSLEGTELIDWVVTETVGKGGQISTGDANYLVDRVGHNQQIISKELEKLLLVSSRITKENINLLTERSPHSSVFNMIDALMNQRIDVASRLYDEQRVQGMEPQAIMGMIVWQLAILANIVAAGSDSIDEIAKRSKLSPFVVRKNLSIASKIGKSKMVQILDLAINTDLKIKTGKVKPDTGVHSLLLEIANSLN